MGGGGDFMKPDLFIFFKDYKKKYIGNDIMAGLLVAIIALPLSIAVGIQSMPEHISTNGVQIGIITAIVAGFLISFLGGGRFQIAGPTPVFVAIVFGYLSDPAIGLLGLQVATIFAGIWMIILGITRTGKIINYIPHSIVVGFTTCVGITIFVGQLKDLFGLDSASGAELIPKLISYGQNIREFNYVTFLIGIFALIIILVLNKINRKIPAAIIAIIVCTGINLIIEKTTGNQEIVQTIGSKYGTIKAEFYPISFAGFGELNFGKLIVPSLVIAMLGAMESLLSATVADSMTRTKHNPNQELLGQGVANIASVCLGGLPATAALARTSVNINAGAKSSISGMIHALFILILYLTLMDVIKFIPLTVFAAILISVAIRMCNFPLFFKVLKYSYKEAIILLATCALTIYKDLVWGVLGGMVVVALLNIPNYKLKLNVNKEVDHDKMVVKVSGPLYVFNIDKLIKYISPSSVMPHIKQITIDLSEAKELDATASDRIAKCRHAHTSGAVEFEIQGLSESMQKKISTFG